MKSKPRLITLLAAALACALPAGAATVYSENFDSMGAAGTTLPAGWTAGYLGAVGSQNRLAMTPYAGNDLAITAMPVVVNAGGMPSPDVGTIFNSGSAGSSDRALGGYPRTNPSGDQIMQVAIVNTTGQALNSVDVSYAGEQWRQSQGASSNGPEMLRFLAGTTSATNGFNYFPSLDFTAPKQGAGNTALDGNLAENRAVVSGTVTFDTAVPAGGTFYLRWHDWNDNGTTDHFLAIDDLMVAATGGGPLAIALTSPTNNQAFDSGTPIAATASVSGGTGPYTVKFYSTISGSMQQVGGDLTSPPYLLSLGTPANGSYQVYATVTDSTSTTVTSETNTLTVQTPVDNTGAGGTITYTDASGLNPVASPPYAGGYVVHTFTGSGTLTVPFGVTAEVLVVGGGGGGGSFAGGGGAGGLIYSSGFAVSGGNTSVTVGAGGAGGILSGTWRGGVGSDSVFGTLIASGGGGGGARDGGTALINGLPGGSGGGGSPRDGAPQGMGGTNSPAGQGYPGGNGGNWGGGGGGGGGAGVAGANASGNNAGAGGNGLAYSISGSSTTYAGGGGGGGYSGGGSAAAGGDGGGGAGSTTANGANGVPNTGGGGGGGAYQQDGGNGGSGIVIVRYPYLPNMFMIQLASPANSQSFNSTASVSAIASVYSGTPPYTVNFYLDSNLVSTANNATNPVTVDLGLLPLGSHTLYATATDSTSTVSSETHTFTVETDTTAPTPNPMTFVSVPAWAGPGSVTMTATTATDAWSPPVLYFFENTINSANSGWISGTAWTDTGLTAGTLYGYRVKARDATGNETAWSGVASAVVPLPGQVPLDFEFVTAGSSSPPAGWSVVTVPGKSGSYTATASGLGSNGTGGSSGLGGQLTASTPVFSINLPGVYLVNSGYPNGLDVRQAITGSYDLNMSGGSAYGSCAFLFGDIASGLPGTAGSLLEIANKLSVFNNDPDQIINGAGSALVVRPADSQRCNVGTWYRVSFTWTPTSGTTGDLSYMVNAYSAGAWKPNYGASVSGFAFDNPQAYFGFSSMVAPSTIFDNINITGTAYSASVSYASWQAANSTSQGLNGDHDNDGVPNGIEYFLGGNTNTTGFTALPGVSNSGGTLSVTWPKGSGYTGTYGTDFVVETSETLTGDWQIETLGGGQVTDDPGYVKYTFPSPLGSRKFARLKVTGP
ncbi:MAG: hypothetical protein NTW21_37285 [Verrucomicrobia bacterium]|nr:hypothetical protein [Verrucomicrobiota bacterium]